RGTKGREADVVRGVRVAARLDEAPDDGEPWAVHHWPVEVRSIVDPGKAEVRIGPVPEVEVYAREILEVEHAGKAIGDACRIDGRSRLEEEAQARDVGELRGVIERLEATGDGLPVVSGRALELVDVGARLEEHPGQLGIVGEIGRGH